MIAYKTTILMAMFVILGSVLLLGCAEQATEGGTGSDASDSASNENTATETEAAAGNTAAETADAGSAADDAAAETAATSDTAVETQETEMADAGGELIATMSTNKGDIHLRLFPDEAPITVANFVNLAQRKFYDGIVFHRVISDFMIQGGDPDGTGRGGPGYQFEDEFDSSLRHSKPGILSMANSGPGTNGSQFFVTHVPTAHLDGKHTIFGEVVGSDDQVVVDAIRKGDKIISLTIEGDASAAMEKAASHLEKWNKILDAQ